jgi:hypothetical protein
VQRASFLLWVLARHDWYEYAQRTGKHHLQWGCGVVVSSFICNIQYVEVVQSSILCASTLFAALPCYAMTLTIWLHASELSCPRRWSRKRASKLGGTEFWRDLDARDEKCHIHKLATNSGRVPRIPGLARFHHTWLASAE